MSDLKLQWADLTKCMNDKIYIVPMTMELQFLPMSTDDKVGNLDFQADLDAKSKNLKDLNCSELEDQIVRYYYLLTQLTDKADGRKVCGKLFRDLMVLQGDGYDWLSEFMAGCQNMQPPDPKCKNKPFGLCDLPPSWACASLPTTDNLEEWGKCAEEFFSEFADPSCNLPWRNGGFKAAGFYQALQKKPNDADAPGILGKFDAKFADVFRACRAEQSWPWGNIAKVNQLQSPFPGIHGAYDWKTIANQLGADLLLNPWPGKAQLGKKPPWEAVPGNLNPWYVVWSLQALMALYILRNCDVWNGEILPQFDLFLPRWMQKEEGETWRHWALSICGPTLDWPKVAQFEYTLGQIMRLDPWSMCKKGWNGLAECQKLMFTTPEKNLWSID